MYVHVVRKQRVETYLDPDVVAQLENDYDGSVSANIRQAVNEFIQNSRGVYGNLDGQPVVEVDKLTQSGNTMCVIDDCPLCGGRHTHGFSDNMQSPMHKHANVPSHRVSHCTDLNGPGGYHLIVTDNTENAEIKDGLWQYNNNE